MSSVENFDDKEITCKNGVCQLNRPKTFFKNINSHQNVYKRGMRFNPQPYRKFTFPKNPFQSDYKFDLTVKDSANEEHANEVVNETVNEIIQNVLNQSVTTESTEQTKKGDAKDDTSTENTKQSTTDNTTIETTEQNNQTNDETVIVSNSSLSDSTCTSSESEKEETVDVVPHTKYTKIDNSEIYLIEIDKEHRFYALSYEEAVDQAKKYMFSIPRDINKTYFIVQDKNNVKLVSRYKWFLVQYDSLESSSTIYKVQRLNFE